MMFASAVTRYAVFGDATLPKTWRRRPVVRPADAEECENAAVVKVLGPREPDPDDATQKSLVIRYFHAFGKVDAAGRAVRAVMESTP